METMLRSSGKIADLVEKSLIWLQQALIRCTDGVPDDSELTKFQRQILQITAQGEYSFEEIFKKLDE